MNKYFISKSRRLRTTPYTEKIEEQGVSSYTIYNHMLLPASFGSLEESYYHLKENVQVWDVSAERQVEISGKDAAQLVQLMTCRDLSKSKDGKCYYCPVIDDKGGLINDPVILRHNNKKWWISIADSDLILFAKGLAIGKSFDVQIDEPNVNIIAVQGPKSFKLMEKIFGEKITSLKFFNFDYFESNNSKYLIAKSGWSKQGGYEIYVEDDQAGILLYEQLFSEGKEFNIKPGCPHLIERIESGLLSYGNDFDNNDNPYECGFDKFVHLDTPVDFLGKKELRKIKTNGIKKKLMGVKINAKEINVFKSISLLDNSGKIIGEIRSGVYSPTFKQVIGIAMIKKPYFKESQSFNIEINGKSFIGKVCDLPFI